MHGSGEEATTSTVKSDEIHSRTEKRRTDRRSPQASDRWSMDIAGVLQHEAELAA
jgi:hypothetical protein